MEPARFRPRSAARTRRPCGLPRPARESAAEAALRGRESALETWHNVMPKGPLEPKSPAGIMRRLTEIVWHYNFMPYFRMKKEREKKGGGASSPPPSAGAE